MLNRLLSALERVMLFGTYIALFLMMVLISIDAIIRYFFNATLLDVYHFTELYLMPLTVFFALAYTQQVRGHVSVSLLDKFVPIQIRRVVLSLAYVAAAICFALIAWRSFYPAWADLVKWRTTAGVVPWPTGISRIIIPIGAGLLALRLLLDSKYALEG